MTMRKTLGRTLPKNGVPTLSDVARQAGTSKGTASRALNGRHWVAPQTREAVLQAAQELGFYADPTAQRLANGRCNSLVGLLTVELDLGVVTRKVQLLQSLLTSRDYVALIHAFGFNVESDSSRQSTLLSNLIRQRPCAIACNVSGLREEALVELQKYRDGGGVLVTYDSLVDLDCDRVIFDRADSAAQAIAHLLKLGHRDIGFARKSGAWDVTRLQGARQALRKQGLALKEQWIFDMASYEAGGADLARRFLKLRQKPSAICITDDTAAAAFIAELGRSGMRVPQDLSVVGHDDMPIAAHSTIPLTTISQPVEAIAREVVELLISRLEGDSVEPARTVLLRGETVVRRSTAPFEAK